MSVVFVRLTKGDLHPLEICERAPAKVMHPDAPELTYAEIRRSQAMLSPAVLDLVGR